MAVNPIIVLPYQPEWPVQFEIIKADLASDLADFGCNYITIEHIGSTSVPGQAAKPVIDIYIIIPAEDFNERNRLLFCDAMFNGEQRGDYRYMGDGGVGGRWSFKICLEPRRNISVVAEGSLVSRTSLAVRDTLTSHPELREKYGNIKMEIARETLYHVKGYSQRKNAIIAEILRTAGWSEEEIKVKEDNVTVVLPEIEPGGKLLSLCLLPCNGFLGAFSRHA